MDTTYHSARRAVTLLEGVQLTPEETAAGLAYRQFYEDLIAHFNAHGLQGDEKKDSIRSYMPKRDDLRGRDPWLVAEHEQIIHGYDVKWTCPCKLWTTEERRRLVYEVEKARTELFGEDGSMVVGLTI
ncbi:hypothetical protein OQA88_5460 [Cercophora sp. LCS_1]